MIFGLIVFSSLIFYDGIYPKAVKFYEDFMFCFGLVLNPNVLDMSLHMLASRRVNFQLDFRFLSVPEKECLLSLFQVACY